MIDLVVETAEPTTCDAIHATVREATSGELRGILDYSEEPIVSSDIVGDPHSSILAADLTQVMGENLAKVVCWSDNEWGHACRCVDLIEKVARL